MRPTRFLAVYFVVSLGLIGLALGGWWTLLLPVFAFVCIPTAELFLHGETGNLDPADEPEVLANPWFDRVVYGLVPIQWAAILLLLAGTASGHFAGWSQAAAIFCTGTLCATLGINVGHELGHHRSKRDQNLAKALLLSTHYMHFFIEHNRGHHANVATEDDPASADRGENVYGFWFKSVVGGWLSAWRLEFRRLDRRGVARFSWQNEMLRFQVIQIGALALAALAFGPIAAASWLAAGMIGALILENINYVEHYGLRRGRRDDGRWERVQPVHSWNSNHPLSRVLLFELTRHSDHHANPSRHFSVLRHYDEAPQLPTGYSGMLLLAMVPPLFKRLMHPRIDAWQAQPAQEAA